MSASLVGSEMCIRDRSGALRSSLELSGAAEWSGAPGCRALWSCLDLYHGGCLLYTSDAADDM
eukprot:2705456-Alexandrium_andersonii.AAC.1